MAFQIEYRAKLAAYKSQITDAQLSALALEKLILMEEEDSKSDKKIQDANFKAMGRPKRPLPPFGVFCMNERQKLTEKISVTDLAAKWKATNADERKIYEDQAKKNSERYRWVTRKCEFCQNRDYLAIDFRKKKLIHWQAGDAEMERLIEGMKSDLGRLWQAEYEGKRNQILASSIWNDFSRTFQADVIIKSCIW